MAHLKAARTICNILWPCGFDTLDKFQRFCVTWLVTHDIMCWRTWVQETHFTPSEWFAPDDETEIDATIVCSRGLIHQMAEIKALITDIRKIGRRQSSGAEGASFSMRRARIEAALHRLRQDISTTRGSAYSELLEIAECKRLSALIYLYAGVEGAKPLAYPAAPHRGRGKYSGQACRPSHPSPSRCSSSASSACGTRTTGAWSWTNSSRWPSARPLASILEAKEIVQAVWLGRDGEQGWTLGGSHGAKGKTFEPSLKFRESEQYMHVHC